MVSSVGDGSDLQPGDGRCDAGGGVCTLRAAIEESNVLACDISFAIGANECRGAACVISPTRPLPPISARGITIDAVTQPGSRCGNILAGQDHLLRIVLQGNEKATTPILVDGHDVVIRGFDIVGFSTVVPAVVNGIDLRGDRNRARCNRLRGNGGGIRVSGDFNVIGGQRRGDGNIIVGNHIDGVFVSDTAGSIAISGNLVGIEPQGNPNGNEDGIYLQGSTHTLIGGRSPGARNVVSGNRHFGIQIDQHATDTVVQGNYVGTDLRGTSAVANEQAGVLVANASRRTVIGGGKGGGGNLISGNRHDGIRLMHGAEDTVVVGNRIGTDRTGRRPVANGRSGLEVGEGALRSVVGGTAGEAQNVISGNREHGIRVSRGASLTTIRNNLIGRGVHLADLCNGLTGMYDSGQTTDSSRNRFGICGERSLAKAPRPKTIRRATIAARRTKPPGSAPGSEESTQAGKPRVGPDRQPAPEESTLRQWRPGGSGNEKGAEGASRGGGRPRLVVEPAT